MNHLPARLSDTVTTFQLQEVESRSSGSDGRGGRRWHDRAQGTGGRAAPPGRLPGLGAPRLPGGRPCPGGSSLWSEDADRAAQLHVRPQLARTRRTVQSWTRPRVPLSRQPLPTLVPGGAGLRHPSLGSELVLLENRRGEGRRSESSPAPGHAASTRTVSPAVGVASRDCSGHSPGIHRRGRLSLCQRHR